MDALLKVRPVAWVARALPFFMVFIGLIGLGGIAADLRAWRDLLGGIDSEVVALIIWSAILLVGFLLLGFQLKSPRQHASASAAVDPARQSKRHGPEAGSSRSPSIEER